MFSLRSAGQGVDGDVSGGEASAYGKITSVACKDKLVIINDNGNLREYNEQKDTISTVCSKSTFQGLFQT